MKPKRLPRPLVDALVIVSVSTVAILAQIVSLPQLVRVCAVVPLLGFIPGYAIVNALFPAPQSLSMAFRGGMAVLLSLCIVPAIATILDSTSWGIRPLPMISILMVLSLCAAAIGWWRENRIQRDNLPPPNPSRMLAGSPSKGSDWTWWVVGALFLAVVATGTYWTLLTPPTTKPFTEFYIEPEIAFALSQPSQGPVEEPATIPFTVVNHENQERAYSVNLIVDGVPQGSIGPVTLQHGAQWQDSISIPRDPTADQRVELHLYRQNDREPYRTLHVWIGHLEPQGSGLLPTESQQS